MIKPVRTTRTKKPRKRGRPTVTKGKPKKRTIRNTKKSRLSRLRKISPDPLYHSRLVTLLIKRVMRQGKKNFAVRLVYSTLYKLQSIYTRRPKKPNRKNTHKFFLEKFSAKILECAIRKVVPRLRHVKKKRGRRSYYIPKGIRFNKGISYAIRWLVSTAYCCCLRCKTIASTRAIFRRKLARAIWRTARGRGGALKKKFCMQQFTYR